MSVTINTSNTTPIKQALSNSLTAAASAATKMATGEQFQHFFEDPTSNAIGLNMRSDLSVLNTVLKGIEQSQSMLYIAESGAKSIYNTVNDMKGILAQAKLGYMTDALVQTTLSPTYVQLKAEINRIADSVNFNGQTLINGQGGAKNAGTSSAAASTATYNGSSTSVVTLPAYASNATAITGISASVNGGASGAVTFSTAGLTPTVTGGSVSFDASGNAIITGATLTFAGTTISDGATPADTGTGALTISGVNLKFASGFTFANGVITATAAPTITNTGATALTASNFSFALTGTTGTVTSVGALSFSAAGTAPTITSFTATGASINNITQTYALSGGVGATSAFSFVTGSDLNTEIIQFNLPNMRLNTNDGVLGMINVVNTDQNILSAAPIDLTNLQTIADANTDIPLIEAMLQKIIGQLDQLGAYETRLINVQIQLQSNVQQVDTAQGVFMNSDLANQTENFTKANVKTNVAISCLKNLSNSLQSLQQLAQ